MAKKIIEEEVIEEEVTAEDCVCLKADWKELLVSSLAKVDASHLEKNAILPLINGLLK